MSRATVNTEINDELVIIVDDDESMRDALVALMASTGMSAIAYGSVQEYLEAREPDIPHCLVLDVRLPGRSGLDLQDQLSGSATAPPVIFLTGFADVPMTVRAMKAGAIEFLMKPFRDQDLIDAVHEGIRKSREQRSEQAVLGTLQERFASLTPRAREVMQHVAQGLLNKQIAGIMGVSEITVKVHRGQAMRKMGAASVAELVRMADMLGVTPAAH